MPLLRVRAAVAVSQPLSQNRGIAVRSPLSSSGLFNSVSVSAAKNPAASRVVRPTPGVPALTSRAGMSLSFVLLTLPAAPHTLPSSLFQSNSSVCSGALVFSLDTRVLPSSRFQSSSSEHSGAPDFSMVAHAFPGSRSQSALSRVLVRKSGPLPVQVATASRRLNAAAPASFHLSSDICAWFHGSPLHTSILSARDVHL